jgi:hypothetical protein
VDESPGNGCPYALNLDTLTAADAVAVAPPGLPATPRVSVDTSFAAAKLSLGALSLSPGRFRAGGRGTTISYTLSAPATVAFRVQRARGRGARYLPMGGHFTQQGARGANALRFAARLRARTLRPGHYRLQAVATTRATGKASAAVHRRFVVVGR